MKFIKDVIRTYFQVKAAELRTGGDYLCSFPAETYAHARGSLALALADFYTAIAEAI